MKKQNITPYQLESYLIIALSVDWVKVFNTIPNFTAYIDESQRLHIVSQEVVQNVSGSDRKKI